jgi:hypothetical protein
VPTTNECRFGERGDGGGGSFTGRVAIGAAAVVVGRVVEVEAPVVVAAVVAVEAGVAGSTAVDVASVVGAAWLSPPSFEESTIAATTPPIAATATTPASTAFLTGAEATLARPWPILAKSS